MSVSHYNSKKHEQIFLSFTHTFIKIIILEEGKGYYHLSLI